MLQLRCIGAGDADTALADKVKPLRAPATVANKFSKYSISANPVWIVTMRKNILRSVDK
jgi:hypothetical protein